MTSAARADTARTHGAQAMENGGRRAISASKHRLDQGTAGKRMERDQAADRRAMSFVYMVWLLWKLVEDARVAREARGVKCGAAAFP